MQARDVMTRNVETIAADAEVVELARRLIARNVSAMPVVDGRGRVVGIVSEGDLMRRPENATERHPSWWIRMLTEGEDRARDYVRSHGRHVRDVMTREVISVSEDTPLSEVAETLEKNHIKRVTVTRGDELVGIVSRADLLRGLVAAGTRAAVTASDHDLREAIEAAASDADLDTQFVSVMVADGVARLWGMARTRAEREALGVAAEGVPGIERVENHVNIMPDALRATMGAQ